MPLSHFASAAAEGGVGGERRSHHGPLWEEGLLQAAGGEAADAEEGHVR